MAFCREHLKSNIFKNLMFITANSLEMTVLIYSTKFH